MATKKSIVTTIFALLLTFSTIFAQENPEITVDELKGHVYFLAADSLRGRKPGTPQSLEAANYIRNAFRAAGLVLLGEDGFQPFKVISKIVAGEKNSLRVGDYQADPQKDFVPVSFSANASVSADVAFVGYGFDFDQDSLSWHDYDGIDVAGKWCLILRGDPEQESTHSPYLNYTSLRKKVLIARDHKAAGVLFVSGKKYDEQDELIDLYFDKSSSDAGIPVFHIKRTVADKILEKTGKTVESLEADLIKSKKPNSFVITEKVSATADVVKKMADARNVIAMLPGSDPVLKNQYIVIGAHFDHLGMGGPGSGSRRPDTLAVHNGADDNASGVAGVIEIIEKLSLTPIKLKRSVIAIAFDGEEMGSLGAKYFVNHPVVDLKKIDFMLNLDMVGRLKTEGDGLTISGTGTALGLENIVKEVAQAQGIKVQLSPEGYGPSDHASFYVKDIPVLMLFTGVHEDYHTPGDDADKINYSGEKKVTELGVELIKAIANREDLLVFQEAGPKAQPTGRKRFKVTLGIVPDYAGVAKGGLRVDMPIKGKPAALAGLKKGDIIIAMEGKQVKDIYDYMNRLSEFKPGQRISVEVLRNGEKKIFIVQL